MIDIDKFFCTKLIKIMDQLILFTPHWLLTVIKQESVNYDL